MAIYSLYGNSVFSDIKLVPDNQDLQDAFGSRRISGLLVADYHRPVSLSGVRSSKSYLAVYCVKLRGYCDEPLVLAAFL